MFAQSATIHGNAPALTAQRSRSHRIQYAGMFVTLIMLGLAYGVYGTWQEYYRDPTYEHLFIGVGVSLSVSMFFFLLAYFVVPKVEFFENHLVARSLWGFSRQRSYQEISILEVKHGRLYFRFNDRGKIALSREEINLEDLVLWLAERGVMAAQHLQSSPPGAFGNRGSKQATVAAVTFQEKATLNPILTVKSPWLHRIIVFLFAGVPGIVGIYAFGGYIGKFLSNPTTIHLFVVLIIPPVCVLLLYATVVVLLRKSVFFENYLLVRSMWGRSQKLSYQNINTLDLDLEALTVTVKRQNSWQVEIITIPRYSFRRFRIEDFVQWLAARGVTAARDLKWPPPPQRGPAQK